MGFVVSQEARQRGNNVDCQFSSTNFVSMITKQRSKTTLTELTFFNVCLLTFTA